MTLEKHLQILSMENDRNLQLYQAWGILKAVLSQKLESVSLYFPHFSLHNATHSETICMQIEKFLGEERVSKLSPTDTWMLLASFYGHDLGMAIEFNEVYDLFQKDEFKEELHKLSKLNDEIALVAKRLLQPSASLSKDSVTDYKQSLDTYRDIQLIIENSFRNIHAERSGNYIKQHPELFSSIPERFVYILAEICEMHQKSTNSIMDLPYKSNGISNDYMHPRLVASLLCLGDLLDLDNDRFNEYILKSATPLPKNSYLHLLKHKSVQHFLVEPDGIEIRFDTDNIEVYRLMKEWCGCLEEVCNFLLLNWSQIAPKDSGVAPNLRKKELLLNHSKKWLNYSDLKFTISNKKAIELLEGADIYRSKFVCIREVIQNAVDATLVQLWNDLSIRDSQKFNSRIEPSTILGIDFSSYSINISVSINKNDNVEICIIDKGTGISIEEVYRISKIGNTEKSEREIIVSKMPLWFRPSGAFGLGLQSIFLLTDKFEIVTKTDDEPAKKIIMESGSSGKGYILIDDYDSPFPRGTKITIEVDPSKITINDLFCSEYQYKTQPKSFLILDTINNHYNNIYQVAPTAIFAKLQKEEYINVYIKCFNPYLQIVQNITDYKNVFDEPKVFNDAGFLQSSKSAVSIKRYDKETMTICSITVFGSVNVEKCYGEREYTETHLDNYIFFKNVVVSQINQYGNAEKEAFYRDFDFALNFWGNNAEEMLKISRSGIKRDFNYAFKKLCDKSLKNTIKKLLDAFIQMGKIENNLILIKLYQLALFFNYRFEEFFVRFKEQLECCSFNNYYDINGNEVTIKFADLKDHAIYFLIGLDEDIFTANNEIKVTELNANNSMVFSLKCKNKKPYQKQHILNHMIQKAFISKFAGKYYQCIEAVPFQSTSPYSTYEKDNFLILTDLILAIINDFRCMQANKRYSGLMTPVHSQFGFDDYRHGNDMVIELPFDNEQGLVLKSFVDTQVTFDKNTLLEKTFESIEFKSNVEYISKYNGVDVEEIELLYRNCIIDLINLLTDNTLKRYIEYIVNCRETLNNYKYEHNHYITF